MVTNIGGLPVREDVIVTIAGTVSGFREDEFLLRDSTGEIWVAPEKGNRVNLNIGDRVTVVGDRDDLEDFDAISITRNDSPPSVPNLPPNSTNDRPPTSNTPPMSVNLNDNSVQNIGGLPVREDVIVTIAGTVSGFSEDEFLLRDSTGEIWVALENGNRVNLNIGDRVTVVGDRDDLEDFDAISITRNDSQETPQILPPNSANNINGSEGNDNLIGGESNDILTGKRGQDRLFGNLGNDSIFGGKGSDTLDGGGGNDTLSGNMGQDFITGGPGNDIFVLSSETAADNLDIADRILDFQTGIDRIQLSPGLSFADLSLETIDRGTVIRSNRVDRILGIVDRVTPGMLSANDFFA